LALQLRTAAHLPVEGGEVGTLGRVGEGEAGEVVGPTVVWARPLSERESNRSHPTLVVIAAIDSVHMNGLGWG
jgi:hypothetical protein